MATQLQIRRGSDSQVSAFTGAEGEIVVNTTNDSIHVNDGSTAGGFELARVDGSNWNVTNDIDITGTVTADSAKVENGTTSTVTISESTGSGTAELRFVATESFPKTKIVTDVSAGSLSLETLGNERLNIANNGDISFYEDTGTTPKFFWDASAESLGIRTSSPTTALQIVGLNQTNGTLDLTPNSAKGSFSSYVHYGTNGDWYIRSANASGNIILQDTGGSVGIGTSSPSSYYATQLVVNGGADGGITVVNTTTGDGRLMFADGTSGSDRYTGQIFYNHANNYMAFGTNGGTERMRLDANGHLILKKNLVLESTSEGIDFSGVGASAQTLDDYEEGVWTPTDASGAGLTITVNASSYTKIGNLCYIYAYITYPITSSTAAQTLGGLPFVTKSSNTYAQLTVRVVDDTVSENNLTFQTTTNSFVGSIHDGTTPIANVDLSGTAILISGVYATA